MRRFESIKVGAAAWEPREIGWQFEARELSRKLEYSLEHTGNKRQRKGAMTV
jgi:hypothetical protein